MRCVFTTVLILYEINLLNFNLLISLYYNPGNLFINLKLIQMYELAVWRLKSLFNRIFISNPENEFSMFGFSTFLLKKEYIIFIFFLHFEHRGIKQLKQKREKKMMEAHWNPDVYSIPETWVQEWTVIIFCVSAHPSALQLPPNITSLTSYFYS